jgi:YidC/Oxa1 family membrane protein insertase
MDRNTTIAFVLIGAILIIWLYMNAPEPTEEDGVKTDTIITLKDTISNRDVDEKIDEQKLIEEERETELLKPGKEEPGRIITIETELAIYELSTRGGNIHKVFLKNFNNWYSAGKNSEEDVTKTTVQLINYSISNAYDLSFVSSDGKAIDTGNFIFNTEAYNSKYSISTEDSLEFSFKLEVGDGHINKKYKFFGSRYLFISDIELVSMDNMVSNNAYDIVWNSGLRFVEENSTDEATYSNASVYQGDEQVVFDASSADVEDKDYNGRVDWISVRNKYFAAVIIPEDPSKVDGAYIEGYMRPLPNGGINKFYSNRLSIPFRNNNIEKQSFGLYIGPVDYNRLKDIGHNLESLVDFGSFFGLKFIVRPIAEFLLLPLFNFLHKFIPNYGFVIVVFSLIIKIVVYPLTKKSYQSMKKMSLLQPKISELKEKFKDEPQKLNKETMNLYKTYGVNPAGGCLPMLLQMPIFIALWGLFRTAIELRQQPFIFWITDLSRPDVILDLGFQFPIFGIQHLSGLALLMGITTFLQQKMTMKDPKQKALIYMMPIMLTLLFMTFPSGLNLYYFMFNVFSIAQQYYINHKQNDVVLEPVKGGKQKQGFMGRLMEAAEKQSKTQQKKKR